MIDFVNLHVHTSIGSMLDSLCDVNKLFNKVKEFGQKAIAITDHGTLASFFDSYNAYKKTGIKFIPGCEIYFVNSLKEIKSETKRVSFEKRKHLVLLAKNHNGYKNLLKINYLGFYNSVLSMGRVFPRVDWDLLRKYSDDLICTSACLNGPVAKLLLEDKYNEAIETVNKLVSIFEDRFYLEIQPHLLKIENSGQDKINRELINISNKFGIPLVVGTDVHYITKEDEKYHNTLLALNQKKAVDDPDRFCYGIDEFFLKTGDEVYNFLNKHYGKDVASESISNTVKIANECEPPDYMEVKGNHLPIFDPKGELDYKEFLKWYNKKWNNLEIDKAFMRFRCIKSFKEKFSNFTKEEIKSRKERLMNELKILEGNNFSSYMLVVSDFIKWAKDNNIIVGPGRGSVGGSLVAYLLDIHKVDPLEYGLLFERFQNAYKKDLPDIDTDFTSVGRDKVKEYCRNKYGAENCAQVSNLNTYTPKNVIADLVKSMRNKMPGLIKEGDNYVRVSEAIKAVIPDINNDGKKVKTLKEAVELSPRLKEFYNLHPDLMIIADEFIGLPRDYSKHAAGMIISNKPIIEIAPLRIDKEGNIATQYEKNRCENIGLVKMDFLAVSNLDMIDETIKNIQRLGIEGPKNMDDIPLDDKETYKMIQRGETKCVFQLGKSGMMVNLCKELKPINIVDIAVVNALGRPSSSVEERKEYINRRFGRKPIIFSDNSLKNSLSETYGLCIFEEQLMGIAQDIAGWDLNKADSLRKLTKLKGKDPKMAEQIQIDFIEGAMKKHNFTYEQSLELWKKNVEPFAGYGFNKSHAVFYSINSYITAYLKCNYPICFLVSYLKIKTLNGGLNKDEEISIAKNECKRLGIKFVPPDINKSSSNYEVLDKNTIVMGLSSIKGMGEKAVEEVVSKQPFVNFIDFINRVNARVINKSKLEVLAKAGCFDSFGIPRKEIFEKGKSIREKMNTFIRKKEKDGYDIDMSLEEFPVNFSNIEWSKQEKLRYEKEVLNELVSGTIDDLFPNFFTKTRTTLISRIKNKPDREEIICEFIVKSLLREFKIKNGVSKGKVMGKYLIEDLEGNETELTVWPNDYEYAKNILKIGFPIKAICQVNSYQGSKGLILITIEKSI